VIAELVGHMLGDEFLVESKDFLDLRTAFRGCGGSWSALGDGDVAQLELLKRLIKAWAKLPGRAKKSEI